MGLMYLFALLLSNLYNIPTPPFLPVLSPVVHFLLRNFFYAYNSRLVLCVHKIKDSLSKLPVSLRLSRPGKEDEEKAHTMWSRQ